MSWNQLGLTLNTQAVLRRVEAPDDHFWIEAPIRQKELTISRIDATRQPEAFQFLVSALSDSAAPAISASNKAIETLRQVGLLVDVGQVPQSVAFPFPCASDKAARYSNQPWPDHDADIVPSPRPRIPNAWPLDALAFQQHRLGNLWSPVWGEIADRDSTPSSDPGEFDDAETRHRFNADGYVTLHDLLPAAQVEALAQYYQQRAEEGFLARDIDYGIHRLIAHNDPVANFWHDQLNARVSHLVGHATKPSYSFVSMYQTGSDLHWHTDRPPCEYTITLLLDYSPLDGERRSHWSLDIQTRDQQLVQVFQRVGDALIFKGRELRHSRGVLPEGHRSLSLLFHFVDIDYDGEMI